MTLNVFILVQWQSQKIRNNRIRKFSGITQEIYGNINTIALVF